MLPAALKHAARHRQQPEQHWRARAVAEVSCGVTFAVHWQDLHSFSELRRRIVRGVAGPLRRLGDARLQQNIPAAGLQRILICRPNHRLGNLLLLTPLMCELEQRLPGTKLDLVVAGDVATELFTRFGNVDRVYSLPRRIAQHLPATVRVVKLMRHAHYDWAVDPCLASQSGRLLAIAVGTRHLLGFPRCDQSAAWMALDPLHCMPQHAAQLPVYLLRRALGVDYEHLQSAYPPLDIRLSAAERVAGQQALLARVRVGAGSQTKPIIGLFTEATGAKRYPREWWRRFVTGLRSKRPGCDLVEILPPDGHPRVAMSLPTYCSPSPRKVAAIISNMAYFVSADCGVMHLASASGTPTLGLFSISNMAKYQPYSHGSHAFLTDGKTPEAVAQLASAYIDGREDRASRGSAGPSP